MLALIIVIHVIVCTLLIIIILIQRGRGSGLVESFSGVESMFGTKTSAFLNRTTTVLSILFFFTCLSLAFLSARQSRSLMKSLPQQTQTPQEAPKLDKATPEIPQQEAPKQEAPTQGNPVEDAPKTK
jgi:preprotein translocase subunit SecG